MNTFQVEISWVEKDFLKIWKAEVEMIFALRSKQKVYNEFFVFVKFTTF